MAYTNIHRSFLTTIAISGCAPFDVQVYGVRPNDVTEVEGYELLGQVLHRRGILPRGADFYMSPPRHDPVLARAFNRQGRLPA